MGLLDAYAPKWLPISIFGERPIILNNDNDMLNGSRYTCLDYHVIGNGSESNVIVNVSSTKNAIVSFSLESTASGVWQFSEDVIVSGQTTISTFCNNREMANIPQTSFSYGGTITTVGTVIGPHVIGSTTGGASKSGGASGHINTWLLAKNKSYLLRFTSNAGSNGVVQGIYYSEV